jgi:hypothetical protein
MDNTVLPQPPHSLHLANEDFFLFPKLKSTLKWWRSDYIETKENSPRDLKVTQQGLRSWLPKLKEKLAAVYLYLINEICHMWWWKFSRTFWTLISSIFTHSQRQQGLSQAYFPTLRKDVYTEKEQLPSLICENYNRLLLWFLHKIQL